MSVAARHLAACANLPTRIGSAMGHLLFVAMIVVCLPNGRSIAYGAYADNSSAELSVEQVADKVLVTTVTVRIAKVQQTAPPAATKLEKREEPKTAASSQAAAAPATAAAETPSPAPNAASRQPAPASDKSNASAIPNAGAVVERLPIRFTPQVVTGLKNSLAAQISVGTGVSLGGGLVVTFWRSKDPSHFRVTLPDGEQATATLVAHDHYSGLCLLQTDATSLPAIELSQGAPAIGAWLMTAASSGIDRPLVSQGIVGGADRIPRGTDLPPLLQCDLRTTSTSCGAPVVDRQGKLVGIVAAVSDKPVAEGDAEAGWTFVVPAKYVARLLAARLDQEVVILQRQRPSLGLTLVPSNDGTVRIESVIKGGPADTNGIRPGEFILEADGRKLRSPYQVMSLVIRKQPGETIEFAIRAADETVRKVLVTLSTALPGETDIAGGTLLDPRAVAMRNALSHIVISRARSTGGAGAATPNAAPGANAPTSTESERTKLLTDQLAAFEQAIAQMRSLLKERDGKLAETDREITRLTAEIERLKGEVEKKK